MAEDARARGVRPGGTYKTLDEQPEVLSSAEGSERVRQTSGLGSIVFLIMYFVPLPLDGNQPALAAILSFTIVYWLPEIILITKMVRSGIMSDIIGIIPIVLLIPVMASLTGLAN